MTGGLHLGNGVLTIVNQNGLTVFNSEDGLFHTINTFSGTQAISGVSLTNSGGGSHNQLNSTTDYTIGACHPDCTDVIGSIKFTLGSQAAGMAYDRWHTMMGGSALWLIDGHGLVGTSENINILQMVWYSFVIVSSQVKLRRRLYISQNSRGTYSILSHTIKYKLKTGLFT